MNFLARTAAVAFCLYLTVDPARAEPDPLGAPEPDRLLQAVREAVPSFVSVSYLNKKVLSGSGDQWVFEGSLNGTILEDLYVDISKETLWSPPADAGESALPPRPVILRKIHARREIIELPVKFQVTKTTGRWAASRVESEPPLGALGMPSSKCPLNSLYYGTSQANGIIQTYNASVKKLGSNENVVSTPSKPTPEALEAKAKDAAERRMQESKETADKKAQEAKEAIEKKTEQAKQSRYAGIRALVAACEPFKPYEGMIQDWDGMHEIVLTFNRVERDGDLVTAEVRSRDSTFQRRDFSGHFRQNRNVPILFELLLIGKETATTKTPTRGASSMIQYRTYFVLTLDEDGNLVGSYGFSRYTPNSTASVPNPTPLNNKYGYPLRFHRKS